MHYLDAQLFYYTNTFILFLKDHLRFISKDENNKKVQVNNLGLNMTIFAILGNLECQSFLLIEFISKICQMIYVSF